MPHPRLTNEEIARRGERDFTPPRLRNVLEKNITAKSSLLMSSPATMKSGRTRWPPISVPLPNAPAQRYTVFVSDFLL